MRRIYIYIRLILYSLCKVSGIKKAEFLRRRKVFKSMGENCFWQPIKIPSHPKDISIGNNVTITADVRFYEHDVVHRMWNNDPNFKGEKVEYYKGDITIEDNVVIGGSSIILYNTHIGHNSLIAAGSVVTKDVEPFTIVGGNPAKKIGDTRELYKKRVKIGE